MTESELIEACLRNDRIAQRTLYDRYKRAMYTLAYRTTSDFDDVDDVLQDAFLDVFCIANFCILLPSLGVYSLTTVQKLRMN